MRRLCASSLKVAKSVLAIAIWAAPSAAFADVTLYDKDGWTFLTNGFIAGHYQLVLGDTDPAGAEGKTLVGGKILPQGSNDPRDNTITNSRIRSGFVGTQIGFGMNRKISESTHVESLIAINVWDISSNRGQDLPKGVDVREAWAGLVTAAGTFKVGRMFSIYASAGSPVVLLAYHYGLGNPCVLDTPTISCASVGAGPQFAGYDAQFRYISPRSLGLQFQVAISDPLVGPNYQMTPFPRADADINFDMQFASNLRLRAMVQGVALVVQRVIDVPQMNDPALIDKVLKTGRTLGVTGSSILDVGGFSVGAGAWTCTGCGTRTVLEIGDPANPLSYDSTGEMRLGRGFFGNARFELNGTAIAAGGGIAFMRVTSNDIRPTTSVSVLKQSMEWHVVLTHRIDTVVFTAEHMQWNNEWHFGEKQKLSFSGVGANYYW